MNSSVLDEDEEYKISEEKSFKFPTKGGIALDKYT